jgi:hypothetical protein
MSGIYGGGGSGGGGGTGILTITGNTGGPITADGANNINVVGTANQVTVTGAGHTETISLIGPYTPATYTAHGVLIGEGTSSIVATTPGTTGQVLIGSTGADPAFGAIGVNSGLTAHSLVVSEGNSAFVALGAATNGQLPIGNTGADPTLATLTAGTGVTIANGAGSITVNAVGGGLTWSVVTVNATFSVNTGVIANKAGTLAMALPTTSAVGDMLRITGINTATGWQITQAAGQQIFFGTSSTTAGAGGSLTSTAIRDSIELVCVVANLTWNVLSSIGNITVV